MEETKTNNLAKACFLLNEEWIDTLPEKVEPYKYSKQHNRNMQKLFSKMRKDKYHKYTKNTTRVLIIAALISSMTTTAFAIPQSREYIIRKLFNHSSYTIKDVSNMETVSDLTVGYIPNGFELLDYYESKDIYSYEFYNDDYFIIVTKSTLKNKTNFDTENYNYEKVIINNIEYIFYHNINSHGVIWNNNQYIFSIDSNLSKEEILKIAEKTE